jgi:glycosyltransferase involved in cell wall biosynthesis
VGTDPDSQSDFVQESLVDTQRVRVARNGVDCNHFQPNGTGNALVAVGRLSSEKGFDVLERVFSELRLSFPQLRCLVAGGGERSLYRGMEHSGYTEDVREIYKQAAIYISTSWVEGMSMALLESQAMGIPAVVRRIGSNSEVIEQGLNGYLAQSEEEYVTACRNLLEDTALRKTMGSKARSMTVERFPVEKQVDEIEAIYDELL